MKKSIEQMKREKYEAYVSCQKAQGRPVLGMEDWLEQGDGLADDMSEEDEEILDRAWESIITDEDIARLDPDGDEPDDREGTPRLFSSGK